MILGYSLPFIGASCLVLGALYWSWHIDRFAGMNSWADGVEKLIPRWLSYASLGDPATWLHHTIITIIVSHIGAFLALLTGTRFIAGAFAYAVGAVAFYAVREAGDFAHHRAEKGASLSAIWRGPPHYTGWAVDCAMDLLCPGIYAICLGKLFGLW